MFRALHLSIRWMPLSAADFAEIATKNLFSQDRNPNVIVDPPKPPPPKPQPPFPVAHGVMLWDGFPPTIVLSEKANGPQKGYHPGDTIGPWRWFRWTTAMRTLSGTARTLRSVSTSSSIGRPLPKLQRPHPAAPGGSARGGGTKAVERLARRPRPRRRGRIQGVLLR